MRLTAVLLACALALPGIAAADKGGKGHGNKGDKSDKGDKGKGRGGGGEDASVTLVFASRERDAARQYFVERHGRGNCPPGLAKKHNGCLPPGQAKKRYAVGQPLPRGIRYEPVPRDLELRIGPAPHGYTYAMLDGDLLKLTVGSLLVADAIQGLVD